MSWTWLLPKRTCVWLDPVRNGYGIDASSHLAARLTHPRQTPDLAIIMTFYNDRMMRRGAYAFCLIDYA